MSYIALTVIRRIREQMVLALGLGVRLGQSYLFSATKGEMSHSFPDMFPASDNCLVRDSEADYSRLGMIDTSFTFFVIHAQNVS